MKKRKKGFTLIELIIVVAIIGILASIAVPKFGDIQKDAKIGADIASAKNIASVVNVKIVKDNYTTATAEQITNGNYSNTFGLQAMPKANLKSSYSYWVKVVDSNPIIYISDTKDNCTPANQVYPEPKTAITGNTETNEYYDKEVVKVVN